MSQDLIEQMNAYGPYDHGVWKIQSEEGSLVEFGTHSLFTSRAETMVNTIVNFLQKTYSAETLKTFSILDVGCYDGWVLTQICKKINFKKMIGVEPRQKNIDKGTFARKVCKEETNCKFLLGGFEDLSTVLPNETFDIVLCLGMLHHTSSIENAVSKITKKCSKLFIVDSMIIPELDLDSKQIAAVINPVDIVYRNKEKLWSIAAYKYESPYFDGSTADANIVNIPQEKLIRMCLQSSRFSNVQSLMSEKDFYPKEYQAVRGVNEVMLAAFKDDKKNGNEEVSWKKDALEYEYLFTCHCPSVNFLKYLYENFKSDAAVNEAFDKSIISQLDLTDKKVPVESLSVEEKELLGAIARSPFEKIVLELAKFQLQAKNLDAAKALLLKVTSKKNSDWRSFYRACFLTYYINKKQKNNEATKRYMELLLISNTLFPWEDLEKICKF
jgi:2-polyprenyl-3-methyl-5-hydroxy-6-metoxy-1,4-benzoquinol methylase